MKMFMITLEPQGILHFRRTSLKDVHIHRVTRLGNLTERIRNLKPNSSGLALNAK
ncbi:hypothetical protein D3C87_1876710 [compost metagenome]